LSLWKDLIFNYGRVNIAVITKRSISGASFALTSRTFVIQIVSFLANFLLTIFFCRPAIFGGLFLSFRPQLLSSPIFRILVWRPALIQKKEAITREDLKTNFTLQQILVVFSRLNRSLL